MSDGSDIRLHLLWATELLISRVEGELRASSSLLANSEEKVRRIEEFICLVSSKLMGADPRKIRITARRRESWTTMSNLRLCRGSAPWQALMMLQRSHEDDEVPTLLVHDPRPAAEAVEAPGSPFGRPVVVPLAIGAVVAMPGWLEWSIRPLLPGSTCDVLRFDLSVATERA